MRLFSFVDSELAENTYLLRRKICPPRLKREQPVLEPAQAYGSILRDPQTGTWRAYYLWNKYRQIGGFNYETDGNKYIEWMAQSDNGLDWTFPDLGVVEVDGSRNNHCILGPNQKDAAGRHLTGGPGPEGFCVLDALAEPVPHARGRYTALYLTRWRDAADQFYSGLCLAWSDDGIRWYAYPENPVVRGWSDTFNQFFYDSRIGRYVLYRRSAFAAGPIKTPRVVARSESPDMIHWSKPRIVLDTDEADADGCEYTVDPVRPGRKAHELVCRGRSRQFYGLHVKPLNNGLYLGLAWMYDMRSGALWPELVHSKDGIQWRREPVRERFISPRGPGYVDAARTGCPTIPFGIDVGDEQWSYVSVANVTHHWDIIGGGPERKAILLYTTPRDRWVAYEADEREGALMTVPIERGMSRSLAINAAIREGGSLYVELCNDEGAPIPCSGAAIETGGRALDTLSYSFPNLLDKLPRGLETFRLRICFSKAKLFAFYLE